MCTPSVLLCQILNISLELIDCFNKQISMSIHKKKYSKVNKSTSKSCPSANTSCTGKGRQTVSGPWSTGWAGGGKQSKLLVTRSAAHRKKPWREARRQNNCVNLAPVLTREHLATGRHPRVSFMWFKPVSGIKHGGTLPIRGWEGLGLRWRSPSVAERWRGWEADFLRSPIHTVHKSTHSFMENIRQKLEVKRSLGKSFWWGRAEGKTKSGGHHLGIGPAEGRPPL